MIDLSGKTALVTGGSRGIGQAIVLRLARQGADVAFSFRGNQAAADATVAEVEALGRRGVAIQVDARDAEAADAMVKTVLEAFGQDRHPRQQRRDHARRPDHADEPRRLARRARDEPVRRVLRPQGRDPADAQGQGRPGDQHHVACPARRARWARRTTARPRPGLIGLTKAAARELASRGITVNAVAPGFVLTELTQDLPDNLKAQLTERTPLGRFGTPEEIADAVAFLASDEAAFITGPGARGRRRPGDDVAVPFTVEPTAIPEVLVVRPRRFGDERGWFAEILQAERVRRAGRACRRGSSRSTSRGRRGASCAACTSSGTRRRASSCASSPGGRSWSPPTSGPARRRSGRSVTLEASADDPVLFWAPASFARGFAALADATEIEYFCTAPYNGATRGRDPLGRPRPRHPVAGRRAAAVAQGRRRGLARGLARPARIRRLRLPPAGLTPGRRVIAPPVPSAGARGATPRWQHRDVHKQLVRASPGDRSSIAGRTGAARLHALAFVAGLAILVPRASSAGSPAAVRRRSRRSSSSSTSTHRRHDPRHRRARRPRPRRRRPAATPSSRSSSTPPGG